MVLSRYTDLESVLTFKIYWNDHIFPPSTFLSGVEVSRIDLSGAKPKSSVMVTPVNISVLE